VQQSIQRENIVSQTHALARKRARTHAHARARTHAHTHAHRQRVHCTFILIFLLMVDINLIFSRKYKLTIPKKTAQHCLLSVTSVCALRTAGLLPLRDMMFAALTKQSPLFPLELISKKLFLDSRVTVWKREDGNPQHDELHVSRRTKTPKRVKMG